MHTLIVEDTYARILQPLFPLFLSFLLECLSTSADTCPQGPIPVDGFDVIQQ